MYRELFAYVVEDFSYDFTKPYEVSHLRVRRSDVCGCVSAWVREG